MQCELILVIGLLLFKYAGSYQYREAVANHPGRSKKHNYRLAAKHSGGFSDEWLAYCRNRAVIDYDQVPIRDPDPRNNTMEYDRPVLHYKQEDGGDADSTEGVDSSDGAKEKESWQSRTWYKDSKPLPFERRGGDKNGLQVLIVTVDNRPLRSGDRNKDTKSIDNTAIINEHYAERHGYDYLYIKTSAAASSRTKDKVAVGDVCEVTKERYNCTTWLKNQCARGSYKGKYDIATFHVGRGYGRASSWNKLPPLIYLTSEYGHLYDYLLFLDSDVMLNSAYHHQSLSDKLSMWQYGHSNIASHVPNAVAGQRNLSKASLITFTNYPWRDDMPCAGVFMFRSRPSSSSSSSPQSSDKEGKEEEKETEKERSGLALLLEWWDFNIPLKNLFDFMEQDALWYMLQASGIGRNSNSNSNSNSSSDSDNSKSEGKEARFKINRDTTSFIYEGQMLSRNTGVPQLFFVHLANYVEQKEQYVNVMLKQLKQDMYNTKGKKKREMRADDIVGKKMRTIIATRYLIMDTVGLCEYAEVVRGPKGLNTALRKPKYYPGTVTGKADAEWHSQESSEIIPFLDRNKYYPPLGKLYNGYAVSFVGFRALFYVHNDTIHEFPSWNTFVDMGFDLDHTLKFRDFGRRMPCAEKYIELGWPLLEVKKQRTTGLLYDTQAQTNGTLESYHHRR